MDRDSAFVTRCQFQARTPAGAGMFRYTVLNINNPYNDGYLRTAHPPACGDHIFLRDASANSGGNYRVVGRSWLHASYGSANWPRGETVPATGPLLSLVVEPADGLLVDEAPCEEDGSLV
ncbi:hypothetical protein [Streptomyces noursei]|uniref:hypothetical protein n=1 Tax=Streptomyces noursei TaxID=1971 RepID=UPI0016731BAA|nr:hypothetical protein [Streptomyces noursei]MCZ1021111.1 hypothetical protein [Streptomyces noursei]MCZ1021142.1 hypothetical protein [Streptomyces noursei]MCZ1021463.1 hypothetical protein [Streptomyces noursei]GGX51428.1 hypothetical protein GCM10010341_86160 [Streptomyces noursei]